MGKLRRQDLIYPELSYKILGCAYKAHNKLGGGLKEDNYQWALAEELNLQSIRFVEQPTIPVNYNGKIMRKVYCDFLIEDLITVEIKSTYRIKYKDFKQTLDYLILKNLKLGLHIVFGREYVSHKRVLNL